LAPPIGRCSGLRGLPEPLMRSRRQGFPKRLRMNQRGPIERAIGAEQIRPLRAYLISFQYAAFKRQAMTVKMVRNNKTQTPSRVRVLALGSDMNVR